MSRAKPDRRIARTQQSLHRSLNTLILEKGYGATTIKDIVAHANVSRSTFYAHHGSKEGLLLNGLHHLHDALREPRQAHPAGTDPALLGFSRTFFEHVHQYRDVFQALREEECGPVITRKIKRMLTDLVRQDLHKAKSEERTDAVPRDAVVRFTVDSLFSILFWWLDHNTRLSPAEADAVFRRLVLPALSGLGLA